MITNLTRYAPGGDLFEQLTNDYGREVATRVYSAALLNDDGRTFRALLSELNAGEQGRKGLGTTADLDASTASNFVSQIINDPLAAPLEAANRQLGKGVWNLFKNPFVLVTVAAVIFFALGGWGVLKRKMKGNP